MIQDAITTLSSGQQVLKTAVSTKSLPLNVAMDMGSGTDLNVMITVDQNFTVNTNTENVSLVDCWMVPQIVIASNAGLVSPKVISQGYPVRISTLKVGMNPIFVKLGTFNQKTTQTYLGMRYKIYSEGGGPLFNKPNAADIAYFVGAGITAGTISGGTYNGKAITAGKITNGVLSGLAWPTGGEGNTTFHSPITGAGLTHGEISDAVITGISGTKELTGMSITGVSFTFALTVPGEYSVPLNLTAGKLSAAIVLDNISPYMYYRSGFEVL
ncbi:hypothetical protein CCP3SC1_70063 [Gammaproteobacteria bacterium]